MSNIDVYDFQKVGKILADGIEGITEGFQKVAEEINKFAEKVGEVIAEVIEILKKSKPRPKYKPVKSLIKPYKEPFIKIRYKARADI